MSKKAYLVRSNFVSRIVVPDHIDPDIDEEFAQILMKDFINRIKEEGKSFIDEAITEYEEDDENPYDPEYDEE